MVTTPAQSKSASTLETVASDVSQEIGQALSGLQHGEITIKVHDGRVVLIERITRLKPRRTAHPAARH